MKSDRMMRSKIYRFWIMFAFNYFKCFNNNSFILFLYYFATLYENNDNPLIYLTLIPVLFWFFQVLYRVQM